MAKRYHVSDVTGKHGVCTAQPGKCPVNREEGDTTSPDTPHYGTVKEAQAGFEERNKETEIQSVSKKVEKSKELLALESRKAELKNDLAMRDAEKKLLAKDCFLGSSVEDFDELLVDAFVKDVQDVDHKYADTQAEFDGIKVKIEQQKASDAQPKLSPRVQWLESKKAERERELTSLDKERDLIAEAFKNSDVDNKTERFLTSIAAVEKDRKKVIAEISKIENHLARAKNEDRFDANMNDDDVAWHADVKQQLAYVIPAKRFAKGLDQEHYCSELGTEFNPSRFESESEVDLPVSKGEDAVVILAKPDGSNPVAVVSTGGNHYIDPDAELGKSAYTYVDDDGQDKSSHGLYVLGYVNKDGERFGLVPNHDIPAFQYK